MSNKAEKRGWVPRLRFPEFRDAGEWIAMKLNEACDVNPENSALPEEFAYIDLESVEAGELTARKIVSRDEAPSRAQRLLHYGDVIFQIVRPYQRNNLHFRIDDDVHYVASTGYAQLRANESADFLFQAVHTDDFVGRVIAKCTGSSYPAINSSDLAYISIAIPSSDEQQKIADCLASLDELTTLEAKKLNTLKTHKRGLMQKLFPAEGETLPKLRFPEFRDAGEWEEKALSQLGDLVSGLTYSPDDVRDEGLLVLRSSNVQNGMIVLDDSVYVRADIEGANPSKPNDILICVRNGSKSLIGKNAVIPEGMPLCTHGAFMTVFRSASAKFIAQLFQTEAYEKQVFSDLGATINSINGNQLKKYKFFVPESAEQQKIADCLASLDNFITTQTQKLAALKTHKKGLMQQLFPLLPEVPA